MQEALGKWALEFVAKWGWVMVVWSFTLLLAVVFLRYRYEMHEENKE